MIEITNEEQFLWAARQRANLDEAVLLVLRTKVGDLNDYLLAELSLRDLEYTRKQLEDKMAIYDDRVNSDRVGTWMPMTSGTRFWPEDPRPEDINIADIAHGLARINRFNGRIKGDHYSVAQHSVLVSRILPDQLKLFGLMHDAAEAYLGDVITPVKNLFRDFYEDVEHRVMTAVANKYKFASVYEDPECAALVKRADTVLLATEARDVTVLGFVSQRLTELPLTDRITDCWSPVTAEMLFLNEFMRLTNGEGTVAA